MPELTIRKVTAASADRVWAFLKQADEFPAFLDDVVAVSVHPAPDGRARVSSWAVRLEGAVLEWTQRERIDDDARVLTFEQRDGDLSALSGVWTVSGTDDGGCEVRLELSFEIGIPLLAEIIDPVATRALQDNFDRILHKMDAHLRP